MSEIESVSVTSAGVPGHAVTVVCTRVLDAAGFSATCECGDLDVEAVNWDEVGRMTDEVAVHLVRAASLPQVGRWEGEPE